ncbi:conjugal transfer protein TraH [Desulfovibrio sp.]|uniref:conjugal transfer protein TraH n=1 Tax=Desulfovibrio sp. TaxID=885 RepID=UPI0025BE5D54|nr:conjugal transfer protein TraH [Desulfovibrio sp.]
MTTTVAAVALFSSTTAFADTGLSGQMNNLFQGINVTSAGSISATGRGGVSLGAVQARSRVVNMNLISFTPPNFNSGCGGIDMFAGSFSFVNLQQFVSLARAVASNAAGFAFHLALAAVSPEIDEGIKYIQKLVNDINQMTHNSCQLAQGIVNDGYSAVTGKANTGMSLSALTSGFSDAYSSFFPNQTGGSSNSPLQALTSVGGTNALEPFTGNIVWAALSGQNVDTALTGASDPLLLQELMSLTGTAILTTGSTIGATTSNGTTAPGNPSSTGGTAPSSAGTQLNSQPLPRTIHVDDLMFGQDNGSGTTAITYLKCDGTSGPNDCQNPSPATDTNYTPITTLIVNRLAGSNNGTGGDGIIDDIVNTRSNGTQIPASDMQFLAALPGRLGSDLKTMSMLDAATAKQWVIEFQNQVALQYMDSLLITFERSIDTAIAASTTQQAQNAAFGEFVDKSYPKAKTEIAAEMQKLSIKYGDFSAGIKELERRIAISEKVVISLSAPRRSTSAAGGTTGGPQ